MTPLTFFLLKIAFLVVLWLFVLAVILAIRSDLFGPRVRILKKARKSSAAPAAPSAPPVAPRQPGGLATTDLPVDLVITEGPRTGHEVALTDEAITIGRSLESSLVLRDDYTSTNHARIFPHNGVWMLEDQGSTNGTTLDGHKVTSSTPIPLDTPIGIGTSVLVLRRR